MHETLHYLQLLHGDIWKTEDIEYRFLSKNKPTIRYFENASHTDPPILEMEKEGYDCFVGIFSRKDKKPCSTQVLWVDIDYKDRKPGLISVESSVILELQLSGIPPSFLVHSGHGVHAYWLLKERLYDHEIAKSVLKRLVSHFNADKCHDLARILRIAGTLNYKDPKNPIPARLEAATTDNIRSYELDEITAVVVDVPSLPDKIDYIIESGDTSLFNDRSECDFAVVKELIKLGYDLDEIEEIYVTKPIGAKYVEKEERGYGRVYLEYTYRAAERSLRRG